MGPDQYMNSVLLSDCSQAKQKIVFLISQSIMSFSDEFFFPK